MSKVNNYYGLNPKKLPRTISQVEIELLYAAAQSPELMGGLKREEHIKNVVKLLYPWVWQYWHEWNELCLWAWCNYEEIGATGCASAHKTFSFSLFSFIEWLAKPTATTVLLTSTTIGALRGRIWNEIRRFYDQASLQFGYNVIDSLQKIQYDKGNDKFAIRGIAVNSGDIEQAIGNIQGIHPERMIMGVDEAAQTPPAIFTARANLAVGTKLYRFYAIANAVDQYDAHGRFCEPKNGWSSITADYEFWETKTGVCLHFDGLKSPNVKRQTTYFPSLFSQKEIDSTKKNFGENSLEWWSYVRGFWAPKGVRNTILDAAMINEGKAKEKAVWYDDLEIVNYAALDPSFTSGGDKCILRFGRGGRFVDGQKGLELGEIIQIHLIESTEVPLNYQIAIRVKEELTKRNIKPENFSMDATAASGLADIISQIFSPSFHRVNFGTSPTNDVASPEDRRPANKVYDNRVAQLWFNVSRLCGLGRLKNLDDDTAHEFCTRQYSLKGEKYYIESKKEMKARTGGTSPDNADAAALVVDNFLRKNSISALQEQKTGNEDWESVVERFQQEASYQC